MFPLSNFFRMDWPMGRTWSLFDDLQPRSILPLSFLEEPFEDVPREWVSTVHMHGFKPEEVKSHKDTVDGKHVLRIHGKHEAGDDFAEIRRNISVPDDVDMDKIKIHMTRHGHLVIRAPYKEHVEDPKPGSLMSMLTEGRSMLGSTAIVPNEQGGEKFTADFNVPGFKPEEIHVIQKGDRVIVDARQDHTVENSTSFRHVRREITVPAGVKVDNFVSQLCEDGHLRLEAPYVKPDQAALEGNKIPVETPAPAEAIKES